jgi:hypothetical protein
MPVPFICRIEIRIWLLSVAGAENAPRLLARQATGNTQILVPNPAKCGQGLGSSSPGLAKTADSRLESLLEISPCSGRNQHSFWGAHKAAHAPGRCGYAVLESSGETVLPFAPQLRLRFTDWNRRGQGVEGIPKWRIKRCLYAR